MHENKIFLGENFLEFETLKNTQPAKAKIHYHGSFEIYYLTKGTCWYFIDKKSYRLTAGDIALIPRGVIHKTSYETENYSRLLINCSENYIPKSVKELIPKIPVFSKSATSDKQIADIFDVIKEEYTAPDEFSEDIIKSKIYELLLLIAKESRASDREKTESPIVEQAVKYIRSHFSEDVTLNDVAKYCFVSREHLSRTFKKETGFGFNEYLNVYRLKKADLMLKNNSKNRISQIASSCGFNDSNYFSKLYKKMYNIAPTKAKMKKENIYV